jgi:hypothetical protein
LVKIQSWCFILHETSIKDISSQNKEQSKAQLDFRPEKSNNMRVFRAEDYLYFVTKRFTEQMLQV